MDAAVQVIPFGRQNGKGEAGQLQIQEEGHVGGKGSRRGTETEMGWGIEEEGRGKGRGGRGEGSGGEREREREGSLPHLW